MSLTRKLNQKAYFILFFPSSKIFSVEKQAKIVVPIESLLITNELNEMLNLLSKLLQSHISILKTCSCNS